MVLLLLLLGLMLVLLWAVWLMMCQSFKLNHTNLNELCITVTLS